jgi:deoxycytidylate deaminase
VVTPVGINTLRLQAALVKALNFYSYTVNAIRLTDLLKALPEGYLSTRIDTASEFTRINTSMDAGNELRDRINDAAALAAYGASRIQEYRARPDGQRVASLLTAHVLLTLKHPREVQELRRIYGPGFFLIAVHAEEARRTAHLTDLGMSEAEAEHLLNRDQCEVSELGQRTRDTFQIADFFLHDSHRLEENVQRFIHLVFGSPREFSKPDEQAMFLAHAAAAKSADLSRQVGAVVLNAYGDVIAMGCNDVPRSGGGQYPGPCDSDKRDYKRPPSPHETVAFQPFVGVGARRYIDLFSMKQSTGARVDRKEDNTGKARQWVPHKGSPRVPLWPATYIEREQFAVRRLVSQFLPSQRADKDPTGEKRSRSRK